MKLADTQPKIIDEVITEVRSIKRAISERHGNDINRLLDSLISQERNAGTTEAEQAGAGKPATRPESKSEGGDKLQPDAEGRSR